MIITSLILFLISIAGKLVDLCAGISIVTAPIGALVNIIGYGIYFIGADTFSFVITSVIVFYGIKLSWAIIEYVYKLIPFF